MKIEIRDDHVDDLAKQWLQELVGIEDDEDEEWLEVVEAAKTILRLNWRYD